MRLLARFTRHPASVGETYIQHMGSAGRFGAKLMLGGLGCLAHALLPFLFERTASRIVSELHDRMVVNRHRRPLPLGGAARATAKVSARGLAGS